MSVPEVQTASVEVVCGEVVLLVRRLGVAGKWQIDLKGSAVPSWIKDTYASRFPVRGHRDMQAATDAARVLAADLSSYAAAFADLQTQAEASLAAYAVERPQQKQFTVNGSTSSQPLEP